MSYIIQRSRMAHYLDVPYVRLRIRLQLRRCMNLNLEAHLETVDGCRDRGRFRSVYRYFEADRRNQTGLIFPRAWAIMRHARMRHARIGRGRYGYRDHGPGARLSQWPPRVQGCKQRVQENYIERERPGKMTRCASLRLGRTK